MGGTARSEREGVGAEGKKVITKKDAQLFCYRICNLFFDRVMLQDGRKSMEENLPGTEICSQKSHSFVK